MTPGANLSLPPKAQAPEGQLVGVFLGRYLFHSPMVELVGAVPIEGPQR